MTPRQALAILDRQIAAHGEDVTLRRIGSPDVTQAARAFVRQATAEELAPGTDAAQAATVVVLSPSSISAFPPERGDRVEFAGRSAYVEQAEPVRMGAEIVRYDLRVTG
jgi:hypothetical protein